MRITRLALERYGHLSDAELLFPPTHGLHVVLGPNEAGKSTALAAIGDCLFGFPHRSPFDFLHGTRNLLVAATLRAGDGREARFVRRKGRRGGDLADGDGEALPESAIEAFLGGATRERFDRVFGLDAEELRRGGKAILAGQGEIGESILQAQTGLHGFRAVEARLDRQAGALFGDRRGERALHAARARFDEARRALDERSVLPTDHAHARGETERLEREEQAEAQESRSLRDERATLDRIRRTAPARRALAEAERSRAELGARSALPPDAEQRRQTAVLARETAATALAAERKRQSELQAGLDALVVDAALLAEAEAIDRLSADRNRISAARSDLGGQREEAERHRRTMQEAARRLGQAAEAEDLVARIPDALTRAAVARSIDAHTRLSERLDAARAAFAAACPVRDAAMVEAAALPPPVASADLRAAIEAAKAEGRLDADRAAAEATLRGARAEQANALASLPLWGGSAAALATAAVPLQAAVAAHAKALDKAADDLRRRRDSVATLDAELEAIAAELHGISALGDLPTAEAILDARGRRDRAWSLIRRHRVEGGPRRRRPSWKRWASMRHCRMRSRPCCARPTRWPTGAPRMSSA